MDDSKPTIHGAWIPTLVPFGDLGGYDELGQFDKVELGRKAQ